MTAVNDPHDEMPRSLSAVDADQILSGDLGADDVRSETAELARFVAAMRAPDAVADPVVERRVVSGIASVIRDSGSSRPVVLSRARSRRISTKVAAAAFVGVIVSGTAAAAATGSLPAGVQQVVSDALSHVDLSVPHPSHHPNVDARDEKPGDGSLPVNSQAPAGIGRVDSSTSTSTTTHGSKSHAKTTTGVPQRPPTSVPGKANGLTTKTTPPAAGNGNGNGPPTSNPGKANGLTTQTVPPAAGNGNGNGPPTSNPGKANGNANGNANGKG
jgi:hypothetical protein